MNGALAPPATASAARRTRVLAIANHLVVRAGLRAVLADVAAVELVAEVAGRQGDCQAAIVASAPDVAVIDVDPIPDAPQLVHGLVDIPAAPGFIVLTADRATEHHQAWLQTGACGLVLKDAPLDVLVRAIRQVHQGELWFERKALTRALLQRTAAPSDLHADRFAALSVRERQIVMLIAEGLRNEQVSARLGVAEKTVRNRLSAIFDQLGVNDRLGLVVYAYQHGLVRPPG